MLKLDGVTFAYGGQGASPVLTAVDAELKPGRLTALLGPNAAGKTTLLKLMLGQLKPTQGQVTWKGQPVAGVSAATRARAVAYVPQRGSVSFGFTAREVVAMGGYARGAMDATALGVEAALSAVDLLDVADKVFGELSGGQQQRVVLARAAWQLAACADGVWLLDEPTSQMDLRHAHSAMARLRDQAAAGAAVLAVMHDVNLASAYADEVWLMADGQMVASGSVEQVMQPEVLEPVYGVSLESVGGGVLRVAGALRVSDQQGL